MNLGDLRKKSRIVIKKCVGRGERGESEKQKQNKIKTVLSFISENIPVNLIRDTFLESYKLLCQSPQPWCHWTESHVPKSVIHSSYRHFYPVGLFPCSAQGYSRYGLTSAADKGTTTGPAGHTIPGAGQNATGIFGHLGTLLAIFLQLLSSTPRS